jgi:hypothetical protein
MKPERPRNLLLQSRVDRNEAIVEVKVLFREWLIRTHFFSALAFLFAISGWSVFQDYPLSFPASVFPFQLSLAGVLVIATAL